MNFKKYCIYIIAIAFPLIGIITSLDSDFPIGWDTFFHYSFSKLIQENHFVLPENIPYFWDGVFAGYPPLFHFTSALLSSLINVDLITVYKVLPWIFLFALLLALYKFFKEFDKEYALPAVIIFNLIPIYLHEFYVGEFARIPGLLFALLCLANTKSYLKKPSRNILIISGVCYGLTVLSHLYAAAITTVILVYWILEYYIIKKEYSVLYIIFLGLIVASPWVIFITKNFGILYLFRVFFNHSDGVGLFAPYIAIIILMLPIIRGLYKRKFYSILVIFLILSIISRMFIMVPISYYISKYLNLYLFRRHKKFKSAAVSTLFMISIFIFSGILTSEPMKDYMTKQKVEALNWVNTNINKNQTIIPFLDYFYIDRDNSEYLFDKIIGHSTRTINGFDVIVPVFGKIKTYTWFGFEWAVDGKRKVIIDEFREKFCKEHFFETSLKYNIYPDYIWFSKQVKDSSRYKPEFVCNDFEPEIKKVFSNSEVDIYKVNY